MLKTAKLCFLGGGHAARHLTAAAISREFQIVTGMWDADVIFVAEDTPVDAAGNRDEEPIRKLCEDCGPVVAHHGKTVVITSQVAPGFARSLWRTAPEQLYCMAETLRIRDAAHRASHPEMMIVGCNPVAVKPLPAAFAEYLSAFDCPVYRVTWEEAEFAKIAINMALAAQVDYANRMNEACKRYLMDWNKVKQIVHTDSRIGQHAYLEPGRWQDSLHLLRDAVTLERMLGNGAHHGPDLYDAETRN